MNLSLLGAILAKFQFWWFSGLFWPFFPCKNWFFWNPFPPIKKRFLEKIKIMPSFYIIKTNEKTLGHLILERFAIFNPTYSSYTMCTGGAFFLALLAELHPHPSMILQSWINCEIGRIQIQDQFLGQKFHICVFFNLIPKH